jgi:hypothetical protein
MRKLLIIWLWAKNVFNLKTPIFSSLEYTNYIIQGKSYFIFSWTLKNAYNLKIKTVNYKSFLKSGSAYIAVKDNNDQIEIVISGSWKRQKHLIKLKQIVIDDTIDFPVAMHSSFDAKLTIPNIKTNFSKLKINSFKANIIDKNQIEKIINISYPN